MATWPPTTHQHVQNEVGALRNMGLNAKHPDFAAVGNGSNDDTAELQALIDAARIGTVGVAGAHLYIPPGEYVISDTLNFYRFSGIVEGAGLGAPPIGSNAGNGTVIRWNGPNTKPMIKIRDYRYLAFKHIRFEGKDAAQPTYGIESNWLTGDDVGTNASLIIDQCHFGMWPWSTQGTNVGKMAVAVGFTGNNGNNDQFVIRDTTIDGCAVGISMPNTQSIWGLISNVLIASATTAAIQTSASVTIHNLTCDNNAVDFLIDSSAQVNVHGYQTERAAKWIYITSIGRLNIYGGWGMCASGYMTSGSNFIQVDFATAGSGVALYDFTIVNSGLASHPKIKVVATGGGSTPGLLRMLGCQTTMVIGDFDVTSVGSNELNIDIASGLVKVKRRFTSASTLGSGDNRPSLAAASTDLSTVITLANDIRTKLINSGEFKA